MNYSARNTISTLAMFLLVSVSPPSYAQDTDLRSCDTQASDADGDGFGWEWNRDLGALGSCRVTENSLSPPVTVNPQTGEEVQLTRAYWNANRDIANRNIECKSYRWDFGSGRFIGESGFDSTLIHNALPNEYPFVAFADYDQIPFARFPDIPLYKIWTVIDGRYIGPLSDKDFGTAGDFDYIELIEATDNNAAGIRVWGSSMRECFDASGADFTPTGFIGEEFPAVQPTEERSLIVTGDPVPDYPEPLTNLGTGNAVILSDAYWDVYQHFWQRSITCLPFSWDGSTYSAQLYDMVINRFYAADKGPQSGFVGTRFGSFGGDGGTNETWTVIDGRLQVSGFWPLTIHDKVELIPATEERNGRVRSWRSSEEYIECYNSAALVGLYENEFERQDLLPLDPDAINLTDESASSDSDTGTDTGTDTGNSTTDGTDAGNASDSVVEPHAGTDDSVTAVTSSGGGAMSGAMSGALFDWLAALLFVLVSCRRGSQRGRYHGNCRIK